MTFLTKKYKAVKYKRIAAAKPPD